MTRQLLYMCRQQTRTTMSFVDSAIDLPWQNMKYEITIQQNIKNTTATITIVKALK